MRTFGAPKSFEMRRGRIEAMDAMRRFVWEAWDASDGDTRALWASSRHPKEIVDTELLPAARYVAAGKAWRLLAGWTRKSCEWNAVDVEVFMSYDSCGCRIHSPTSDSTLKSPRCE